MSSETENEMVARWVIYPVAAVVATFIVEYGFASNPGVTSAVVYGVAAAIAVAIADLIVQRA